MSSFVSRPRYLYIHWPFCSFKCHYCDFVAFQEHAAFQERYHHALINEISTFASTHPAPHQPLETIFIGGGTPSLYPIEWISQIFEVLERDYKKSTCKEITLESNPADIDEERLEAWEACGINRLSVGVQALNDDALLKLNRRQRITDVLRVMKIAPKYIQNLSIDLILGLPGITPDAWIETIKRACDWPIEHISIYFLTVHEKTPLYFKVEKGDVSLPQDEEMIELYEKTIQILSAAGFEQYEISNFARNQKPSIHNQAYWSGDPYKGFGVGASSFSGSERITNSNNLTTYLESCLLDGVCKNQTIEKLTPEQRGLELLMLSLRQSKGLDLHSVVYLLSPQQIKHIKEQVPMLAEAGLVTIQNDIVRLTTKGMTLENEVVVRLFTYKE